ncbi:methyltransferase domain-domain-containing protein [Catenaria anguillulae PL171]|uniref:Methyltransferase domain-domain-containing protein n=1 Tax=Catenaria anguillulae PL171 TaxID=765915 RepID=A0A1Y2HR82_9FUNG|nr:methyltransferase domain-domain-containing protein [Catenaria anguillulae PL171]
MDDLPPITLPPPYAPPAGQPATAAHLQSYIQALTSFLDKHAHLYNFHAVDFFVDNTFDTHLPPEWTAVISDPTESDDAFLDHVIDLASNISSRFDLLEPKWPSSLLAFIRSTHAIGLPRTPAALDSMPRHPIDKNIALGMTPKKVHEVHHLAAFISHAARAAGVTNLIDLGAGQGYLSSVLALKYGHNVLGVDTDPAQGGQAGQVVYLNKHVTAEDTFEGLVRAHLESDLDEQLDLSRVPEKLRNNPQFLEHQRMRMRQEVGVDGELDWTKGKWGLIGLHTCGDLAPITLRMWHTSTASLVINVGSRDKLRIITEARSRSSPDGSSLWTQAISIDDTSGATPQKAHAQTPIAMPLNSTATPVRVPMGHAGDAAKDAFKRHVYRALLQVWITRHTPGAESPVVAVHTTKTRRGALPPFPEYAREAPWVKPLVEGTGAAKDEDLEAFYQQWVLEGKAVRKIAFMWTLRALMAGALESLILVDRYCWMQEVVGGEDKGWSALFPLFDEVDSPRNCVVVGIKKDIGQ